MLKSILVGASLLAASLMLGSCGEKAEKAQEPAAFVTIQGQDLIKPDGTKLFIMGTNLGNWLNPEGYMFKFSKKTILETSGKRRSGELIGDYF